MTIERDGKVYALTDTELREAFEEQQKNYHIEDIEWCIESNINNKVWNLNINILNNKKLMNSIANVVEEDLADSDDYMGTFWNIVEHAVDKVLQREGIV